MWDIWSLLHLIFGLHRYSKTIETCIFKTRIFISAGEGTLLFVLMTYLPYPSTAKIHINHVLSGASSSFLLVLLYLPLFWEIILVINDFISQHFPLNLTNLTLTVLLTSLSLFYVCPTTNILKVSPTIFYALVSRTTSQSSCLPFSLPFSRGL